MRLSLDGVTKSYGAQLVLDDVSLVVGPRSRIGLVGPNGVGKSTLLRILAGGRAGCRHGRSRAAGILVGYLAQERDVIAGEPLIRHLAAHRRRGGRVRARPHRPAGRRPRRGRPLPTRSIRAAPRRRRPRCAGARGCAELGLGARLDRPVEAVGRRGGSCRARDPARGASTSSPRRADEPGSHRLPAWAFLREVEGGVVVIRTTARSSTRR
jgi:hypothetical protein